EQVDPPLRADLAAALRTLRDAGNPVGTLLAMSRLGLRLLRLVFEAAGQPPPSDNLFDCVVAAGHGDPARKVKGLGLLPDEIASCLHTIRTLSNKADHAAERVRLTAADAENALHLFLRALTWFYCEAEFGPRIDRCGEAPPPRPAQVAPELP